MEADLHSWIRSQAGTSSVRRNTKHVPSGVPKRVGFRFFKYFETFKQKFRFEGFKVLKEPPIKTCWKVLAVMLPRSSFFDRFLFCNLCHSLRLCIASF